MTMRMYMYTTVYIYIYIILCMSLLCVYTDVYIHMHMPSAYPPMALLSRAFCIFLLSAVLHKLPVATTLSVMDP